MTAKKIISCCVILAGVPAAVWAGVYLFDDRKYNLVSLLIVILAMIPFFLTFERKKSPTRRLVLLAVLTALSVAGRFLFSPLQFVKPVTAMVIITAMYMGPESGFLCGAMTAVISNFYFGQGPWTPFQMFVWGILGFIVGLFSRIRTKQGDPILERPVSLVICGIVSAFLFSALMDVWTVISADGTFHPGRYAAVTVASLPISLIYAASNVVFLLLMAKPLGKRIRRVLIKYGL